MACRHAGAGMEKQESEGKKMENQNQNGCTKTNIEKICNALGLEMYQLFNLSAKCATPDNIDLEDGPYFFTECGICKGDGEPAQGILGLLAAGGADIKPLGYYKHRHIARIGLEKLQGKKVRAEIASAKAGGAEKALYAVSTIGGQGTAWQVVFVDEDDNMGSKQFADLAEAVKFYNEQGPIWNE